MQFGIELGYIVIPFCLVKVACYGNTQVVFCYYVLGFSVIATFACHA